MATTVKNIDVHRKRSQVAVVGDDGRVQLNRNVVNGSEPMLGLLGGLPPGTPVAFEAAFGWGWLAGLLEARHPQQYLCAGQRLRVCAAVLRDPGRLLYFPAVLSSPGQRGFAAKELIDASHDADLVVIGSRGGGGFGRLMMGSVSSQVVNHAACPVVVVPHER